MRPLVYVLVMVVLTLVVGWAGHFTWLEFRQLRQSFSSVPADAFQLADHVEAALRDMNEIVLRFESYGHAEDKGAFQSKSRGLQDWLRVRQPAVTTRAERELLGRIAAALETYTTVNLQVMEAPPRAGITPAQLQNQVENRAAPLHRLSQELNTAEGAAQTRFMQNSQRALGWLQELLAVELGLLGILAATAAVAVYRGMIGPLRIELNESRARAARHEKLASLGTLAAGVAHEIRNPLTAINVRLHSLKKGLADGSSEEEDALIIGHEIQRLEKIVQGFLQFARPADPKPVAVSADSLLVRVQSLFGPRLEKTAIRLNLESTPDLWIQADPHQIEQVLINLMQNACESIEGEGLITLRARRGAARGPGRARPAVVLEVSDNGKGIPPEVRQRIFDPFFTTKEEGTGLGLAISAAIIEKHGGALECRSESNRGTTFSILLPHANPEGAHEPAA